MQDHRVIAGLLVLSAWAAFATEPLRPPAAGGGYETPPVFAASSILPPDLARGPYHRVDEDVHNDGYLNHFRIRSEFGDFETPGEASLATQIHEIHALAEISRLSKTEIVLEAIEEAALSPYRSAKHVVTHPVQTVLGVPRGIVRLFKRAAHGLERGIEEETESGTQATSVPVKGPDRAERFLRRKLGFERARRKWALKLGVDPYTSNHELQEGLEHLAWGTAAGGLAVELYAPRPPSLVRELSTMDKLVWQKSPRRLRRLNQKRLAAMGADKKVIDAFFANPWYSPTRRTHLVGALHGLEGTADRSALARLAASAESEAEARFFQQSVELLAAFERAEAPITRVVADPYLPVALTADGCLLVVLAVDYLVWTEEMAAIARDRTRRFQAGTAAERLELWLSGQLSERSRQELGELGWSVCEEAFRHPEEGGRAVDGRTTGGKP